MWRTSGIVSAAVAALIGLVNPASLAAARPQSALDYGPHPVGFRVVEALDSTRAFRPKVDWQGRTSTETARPVQIGLWYPAAAVTDGRAAVANMVAGDFRLLAAAELSFQEPGPGEAARMREDAIREWVDQGLAPAEAAAVWDDPTGVTRDAPAARGRYPVVIYFTSAGVINPLLPAYLASHGFVVATFPSNGRMTGVSLEYTPNALTLDTDIDDAGFVHAVLRSLPMADTRRLGLASFSGGSLTSLLWAMRDMQADAIVTLEGWERYRRGADIIRESVHYDPARLRVPFLLIERAPDETSAAFAKVPDVVDSLRFADRTRVAFRDAAHGDFLSHVPAGRTADQPRIYARTAQLVRTFLQAHLQGDAVAAADIDGLRAPPDGLFTVARQSALPASPTEEELYRLAETDPEEAVRVWRAVSNRTPGVVPFREHVMVRAAQYARTPRDRVMLLEMVVDAYPGSEDARARLQRARREAGG